MLTGSWDQKQPGLLNLGTDTESGGPKLCLNWGTKYSPLYGQYALKIMESDILKSVIMNEVISFSQVF